MNCIYTAIFGDYDDLKEPLVITPGWDYLCITDQPFKSDVWQVQQVGVYHNAIKTARNWKIEGYPINGKSIYIDGSFTINCDLNRFWEKHFVSPMTVIQHPMRDCIYDEAATCQRNKRGNADDIAKQIGRYQGEGMPMLSGLIQSGIILRENTESVRNFCNLWWNQMAISTRDQIGFAYAEWKTGFKWPRIKDFDYRNNQDFIFKTHKHRRKKYEL